MVVSKVGQEVAGKAGLSEAEKLRLQRARKKDQEQTDVLVEDFNTIPTPRVVNVQRGKSKKVFNYTGGGSFPRPSEVKPGVLEGLRKANTQAKSRFEKARKLAEKLVNDPSADVQARNAAVKFLNRANVAFNKLSVAKQKEGRADRSARVERLAKDRAVLRSGLGTEEFVRTGVPARKELVEEDKPKKFVPATKQLVDAPKDLSQYKIIPVQPLIRTRVRKELKKPEGVLESLQQGFIDPLVTTKETKLGVEFVKQTFPELIEKKTKSKKRELFEEGIGQTKSFLEEKLNIEIKKPNVDIALERTQKGFDVIFEKTIEKIPVIKEGREQIFEIKRQEEAFEQEASFFKTQEKGEKLSKVLEEKGVIEFVKEREKARKELEDLEIERRGRFKENLPTSKKILRNSILLAEGGAKGLALVGGFGIAGPALSSTIGPATTSALFTGIGAKEVTDLTKSIITPSSRLRKTFEVDPVKGFSEEVLPLIIAGPEVVRRGPRKLRKEIFLQSLDKSIRPQVRAFLRIGELAKQIESKNPGKVSRAIKEIEILRGKEDVKAVEQAVIKEGDFVFGTVSASAATRGALGKKPGDIDLVAKNPKKFSALLVEGLSNVEAKGSKVSRTDMNKIDSTVADVKEAGRLRPRGGIPLLAGVTDLTVKLPKLVQSDVSKRTRLGEELLRKSLGSIQAIVKKDIKRRKDPSAAIRLAEFTSRELQDPNVVDLLGVKKRKIKQLEKDIALLRSPKSQKVFEKNIPQFKEKPLLEPLSKEPVVFPLSAKDVLVTAIKSKKGQTVINKESKISSNLKIKGSKESIVPEIKRLKPTVSRIPITSRIPSSSQPPSISKLPVPSRVPSVSRLPSSSRVPSVSRLPTTSKIPTPSQIRTPSDVTKISKLPSTSKIPTPSKLITTTLTKTTKTPTTTLVPFDEGRKQPGFVAEVREIVRKKRDGKPDVIVQKGFVRLNSKPLTESDARSLAARAVDQSAARTGRIRRVNRPASRPTQDFYYSTNQFKFRGVVRKGKQVSKKNKHVRRKKQIRN